MSKKVRCLVCKDIISYDNDDTTALVNHLNSKHCGIDVFKYLTFVSASKSQTNLQSSARSGTKKRNESKDTGRQVYWATVESWRPGPNKITCPYCCKEGIPTVRRQKSKISQNPIIAFLMMGCWPLCSIPFVLCNSRVVNLYCPSCSEYLGSYDERKKVATFSKKSQSEN